MIGHSQAPRLSPPPTTLGFGDQTGGETQIRIDKTVTHAVGGGGVSRGSQSPSWCLRRETTRGGVSSHTAPLPERTQKKDAGPRYRPPWAALDKRGIKIVVQQFPLISLTFEVHTPRVGKKNGVGSEGAVVYVRRNHVRGGRSRDGALLVLLLMCGPSRLIALALAPGRTKRPRLLGPG